MEKLTIKKVTHASRWIAVGTLCAAVLTGCGSSNESGDLISASEDSAGEPFFDPTLPEANNLEPENVAPVASSASGTSDILIPDALPQTDFPFDDPTDLDGVGSTVTLADTGLQIGFVTGLSSDSVDVNFIEASWTRMQSCLNVTAVSPLVIVSDSPVVPTSSADDVLFQIDGSIAATSTQFASGATIQIGIADLDGSLNRVGFNLRSIMGRYLWSSANLPERDYPHSCASEG